MTGRIERAGERVSPLGVDFAKVLRIPIKGSLGPEKERADRGAALTGKLGIR
jgi:hypothetical protein